MTTNSVYWSVSGKDNNKKSADEVNELERRAWLTFVSKRSSKAAGF